MAEPNVIYQSSPGRDLEVDREFYDDLAQQVGQA